MKSVEKHEQFVLDQVKRARTDEKFGREMTERWNKIKAEIPISTRADRFAVAASGLAGDR